MNNMNNTLIYIFIMASVTYLIRLIPFILMRNRKIESIFIKRFLDFTPYAVLGSMTFPYIFYSTGDQISGILGTIMALFLSYFGKGLTKVAVYTVILYILLTEY